MAPWNLGLRLLLELAALVGLGLGAWHLTDGAIRWMAVILVPLGAAVAWGVFNVVGDPSRSGAAPVQVAGWLRLAIELAVLALGGVGLFVAFGTLAASAFAVLVGVHYASSAKRLRWLVRQ